MTQLFIYLLTQRRTADTPTSVCLLLRQDIHGDRQQLPKIWIGTFLVHRVQSRGKI